MKTKVHSFLKLMVKPLVSALVFISFVLLGGAVILARNSDVAALRNLKAGANDKKLTATNWDILIEYIAGMDAELQSLKQSNSSNTTTGSIPAGAVMAFDLSACPSGWTRFSAADNRFIMGSTSNSKETGGKSSVMLAANQIAPHSHWMVDSFFAESYGYTGAPY
ncbi:MAG: hypothetical protein LBU27_02000 [Candidatus Peribacteria bacterium]|jgi:hypothetical protein|nr:hypothetical protein [Candidatus Peribacteria bacterium]